MSILEIISYPIAFFRQPQNNNIQHSKPKQFPITEISNWLNGFGPAVWSIGHLWLEICDFGLIYLRQEEPRMLPARSHLFCNPANQAAEGALPAKGG
jgi:hypothetical protein